MANILEYDISIDDLIKLGNKAAECGDVEKAIINFKKALKMDTNCLEATLALSNVYTTIGEFDIANSVLYKFLTIKDLKKKDKIACYNQLAYNFIRIKNMRVAEYYAINCDGEFELPDGDYDIEDEPTVEPYKLYDKDSIEENQKLLDQAYVALRDKELDKLILCCDKISDNSPLKNKADHLVLISMMVKEDFQGCIDNAIQIIEKRGESLSVLTSVATCYWLMGEKAKAYEMIDHILEKQYESEEDVFQLLPLLVNTEMHVNVLQYSKKALQMTPFNKDVMLWCAQSLYNVGQIKESKKLFNKINVIFDDRASKYYLNLIETKPEIVEYSTMVPYKERTSKTKEIQDMIKNPKKDEEFDKDKVIDVIDWMIEENTLGFVRAMEPLIRRLSSDERDTLIKKHLIDWDNGFNKTLTLLSFLIDEEKYEYEFDLVAEDRFKHIKMRLPNAYFAFSDIFKSAVLIAICEIIQADDEANVFVKKLVDELNDCFIEKNGKWVPKNCSLLQFKHLKSIEVLVGIMIVHTYNIDKGNGLYTNIDASITEKLNKEQFVKYYSLIYGEEYEPRKE